MSARHICCQVKCFLPLAAARFATSFGIMTGKCVPSLTVIKRNHFLDARDKDHDEKSKSLTITHEQLFDQLAVKEKNKKTFTKALSIYLKRHGILRRGHVEFIYASLEKMKEFGVEKDLDVYKQIIGLFPKGKMRAMNVWQSELMHYPKQQQCMIDLLDRMEYNGVIPDDDIGYEIIEIFNRNTRPFRKYQRMMYWMPKFKYANPYYIPQSLPNDPIELAKMALKRMAVDLENALSVFYSADIESAVDKTFIVSAQSPIQQDLIADHPADVPLYVEGGFITWLRDKSLTYYVLRGEQTQRFKIHEENKRKSKPEDEFKFFNIFEEEDRAVLVKPSVHEQVDGTVLGMCITGSSSKDSLASWIKFLQDTNPRLADIPVLFLLRSPAAGLQVYTENDDEGIVIRKNEG